MKALHFTLVLFLGSCFFSTAAYSENGISESNLLLQQAVMQSNTDYNKLKKVSNEEVFDRADEWSERNSFAIQVESEPDSLTKEELNEYRQLKEDFKNDSREVSSYKDK